MYSRFILGVAAAMVAGAVSTNPASAGKVFDKIRDTGKLRACIKVDYPPFGFLDASGKKIGLEHDLLADIVRQMEAKFGKKIEVDKIKVIAANRIQFLKVGKCDLLIATMTDKLERQKLINIIKPNYYSSGVNLLAKKSVKIKSWDDIRGQTICTSQGAFWNKEYRKRYDLNLLGFAGIAETEQALRDGRCIAMTSDDSLINSRLQNKERWGDYEMKVETQDDAPWGMAIQHGDNELWDFLSLVVAHWHRDGVIVGLEKKWGMTPTKFVREMNERYMNR